MDLDKEQVKILIKGGDKASVCLRALPHPRKEISIHNGLPRKSKPPPRHKSPLLVISFLVSAS